VRTLDANLDPADPNHWIATTFQKRLLPAVVCGLLAACGGGDDDDGTTPPPPPPPAAQTANGVFKDANVSGLGYTSGGQTGLTSASGGFTYEVGQQITFRVGAVTLGSVAGKALITPMDLVTNGTTSTVAVQNVVRFLMMLDADGDATNGIAISDNVRTRAGQWTQVDFTTADLPAALATIRADAQSADGGTHVLPDAATAQAHFERTLRCARAGAFRGTYSGDDTGTFGALVLASNNNILGLVYSTVEDEFMSLVGQGGISSDQSANFVIGIVQGGARFNGSFSSPNALSGTWVNGTDDGNFTGTRIGGTANAVYRFTGAYAGDDAGLFSIDIDGNNAVTGVAYSVIDDELINITGTLNGTTLSVSAPNGTSATGQLNTTTGQLTGTWMNNTGGDGNFGGDGCRLN